MFEKKHGSHGQERFTEYLSRRTVCAMGHAAALTCRKNKVCTTVLVHIIEGFGNFQPDRLRLKSILIFPYKKKIKKK